VRGVGGVINRDHAGANTLGRVCLDQLVNGVGGTGDDCGGGPVDGGDAHLTTMGTQPGRHINSGQRDVGHGASTRDSPECLAAKRGDTGGIVQG
jgi:hypothetical protein